MVIEMVDVHMYVEKEDENNVADGCNTIHT